MKRTFIAIAILAVCCFFAFADEAPAKETNWWLGPKVEVFHQGVQATCDLGRVDINASLTMPLIEGLSSIGQVDEETGESEFNPVDMFLWNNLRLGGYYSLVDGKAFKLDLGAEFMFSSHVFHHLDDPENDSDSEGWGSVLSAYVFPSIRMDFKIGNDFSLFVDGYYPGAFLPIFEGIVGNQGTNEGLLVLADLLTMIYDCVSIGCLVRL